MLNKELLTSTGLSYNPYADLHFAAKMRKLSTDRWIWEYSRDLDNVVGKRIPWWIRDDNYLAKVEIYGVSFIFESNSSWNLVDKNHGLNIKFYNHYADYAGVAAVFADYLYVLEYDSGTSGGAVKVDFTFLNDNPILGITFSGTYTNVNGLENNWKPKGWIEL